MPRVNRKVAMKRGLLIELPLERHLRDFYGPDPDKDKWIRRHALFHYLYKKQEEETAATRKSKGKAKGKADDAPASSSPKDQDKPDTLHYTFTHLAHLLSPPKLRRRRKTKPRVRIPEFSTEEEMHAGLLSTMKTELHSNELHTCFDYLSFYRHAYALILRIRNTVLLSDEIQQQRSAETDTAPEVSNMALIVELFRGLRLESEMEGKKEETPTQELSMKVVPLEQITRIAELMREVICREGDVEVRSARMMRERKWDTLKASYAAADEDAGADVSDGDNSSPIFPPADQVGVREEADEGSKDGAAVVGVSEEKQVGAVKRKFEADSESEMTDYIGRYSDILSSSDEEIW